MLGAPRRHDENMPLPTRQSAEDKLLEFRAPAARPPRGGRECARSGVGRACTIEGLLHTSSRSSEEAGSWSVIGRREVESQVIERVGVFTTYQGAHLPTQNFAPLLNPQLNVFNVSVPRQPGCPSLSQQQATSCGSVDDSINDSRTHAPTLTSTNTHARTHGHLHPHRHPGHLPPAAALDPSPTPIVLLPHPPIQPRTLIAQPVCTLG